MKFGFDYGGVVGTHEWAREMARGLLDRGHEVYVVSAVSSESDRTVIEGLGIPFTGYLCVMGGDPRQQKVDAMKEHGISILLDDSLDIIAFVRQSGLTGLHVG
jgi:hypothetical protein